MFSHITIGANDMDRAAAFYTAFFAPLGVALQYRDAEFTRFGRAGEDVPFFTVLKPFDDSDATAGNGAMVAFQAPDRAAVRAAYETALAQGGTCEGPPGPRPQYGAHYYGAYLRDPDGNKLHVVCRQAEG